MKNSSYVDDLIDSKPSKLEALKIAKETEERLAKGGFSVKCWQFSGESKPRVYEELIKPEVSDNNTERPKQRVVMLKGTDEHLRVLGLGWNPENDSIIFEVTLNFSSKKRGVWSGPDLVEADLPKALPNVLTRRVVLEQVMKIYDPLGLISPFTLLAKIYLRETWSRKLGWDDPLPADICQRWSNFFTALFKLQRLCLKRCLKPVEAIGQPWLIILSDGSDLAYGFAAYIRWKLENGRFWCRLIMAKCRIAPINKLSTPQMELNAAVLSKRGRKVIGKEMRFTFEKVLQIVDSETELCMLNKTSTRFKIYEGVRIGEIQAATDGDMSCWAWISGEHNTADWLTRGRTPEELDKDSDWWNGPPILYKPIEEWGLKFKPKNEEMLPGEKKVPGKITVKVVNTAQADTATHGTVTASADVQLIDYKRFSDVNKLIWVVARVLSIAKNKSFKHGNTLSVSAELLRKAENFIVKDAQRSLAHEMMKVDRNGRKGGRYSSLTPVQDEAGNWVVGQRLTSNNPMTTDSSLQKLLPYHHPVSRLLMQRAHSSGHRERDATLARFRQRYWVPQGSKLAQSVKSKCQMCKLREAKFQTQLMGKLPEARLKPAPAFNKVMLDLFGPYTVRGEVQKRTNGKAYGVIFTDLAMRAVHIEAVFGYDTEAFLLALSRFVSVRGWPEVIYSDPGSQLVGAERELKEAWKSVVRQSLHKKGADNGLTWVFGPADAPWYQGAVESMVKGAKRAIKFAVNNQRLSASEFLTVCSEVSNLLNERPIGTLPGADSELNILTPNSLLLGRATAKNPGGWQPQGNNPRNRYYLVQRVIDEFWRKWTELYAPALVIRRQWNTTTRNLRPGDVVIIADKNTMRGEYRLGLVREVFPSRDKKVRRVSVMYKNFQNGDKLEYKGDSQAIVVTRSTQRLSLLVPVDEEPAQETKE